MKNDQFQKFLLEDLQIRGEWVRLEESWLEGLGNHSYPMPVATLLGETTVAALLLTGTLKFEGRLSIHARGQGALTLLMAEATNARSFRCIARYDEGFDEVLNRSEQSLKTLLGNAQLAITIEPDKGARYQGIVPMERASMADCLAQYFELSEQLDTHFLFHVTEKNCIGLMLQKLPDYRLSEDQDAWDRVVHLASTLSENELESNDNETLLHRVFHEEKVTLFEAEPVSFKCSCSRERSQASIEALGKEEALEILETEASISVDCQFCGRHYEFDREDIHNLFSISSPH